MLVTRWFYWAIFLFSMKLNFYIPKNPLYFYFKIRTLLITLALKKMVLCLLDAGNFDKRGRSNGNQILFKNSLVSFFPKSLHFLTLCFLRRIAHSYLLCHVKVVGAFFLVHPTGTRRLLKFNFVIESGYHV